MRWIIGWVFVCVLLAGCCDLQEPVLQFHSGQVVYHRLTGQQVMLRVHTGMGWHSVYSDQMGQFHEDYFPEDELTAEAPEKK